MIAVKIDVKPISELHKAIVDARPSSRKLLLAQIEIILKHVVEHARLNAPILTGDLRKSIGYTKPRFTKQFVAEGFVVSDLPYALRVHEEEFNLGDLSARQPDTPEGGVGNKYITRVIDYHSGAYTRAVMESLLLLLGSKKIKPREIR